MLGGRGKGQGREETRILPWAYCVNNFVIELPAHQLKVGDVIAVALNKGIR